MVGRGAGDSLVVVAFFFFLILSARRFWLQTQSIMGVVDARCQTPRGADVSEIHRRPSGFKHLLNDSAVTLKRQSMRNYREGCLLCWLVT